MDRECPWCDGNGWTHVVRRTPLLQGHFEETCKRCNGSGVEEIDLSEEAEE